MIEKPKRKRKNDDPPLKRGGIIGIIGLTMAMLLVSVVRTAWVETTEAPVTAGIAVTVMPTPTPNLEALPPYERGQAYAALGRYLAAGAAFTAALEADPNDNDALFGRASAYAAIGDYAAATNDYSLLLERGPNNEAEVWGYLADIHYSRYERTGRQAYLSEAAAAAETSIQLADGNAPAGLYRLLGRAYDALGEADAALSAYETYLERTATPDDIILERVAALR